MPTPLVAFDEAAHRYTVDGIPAVSITQMIKACGASGDMTDVPARFRDEGQALHAMIEASLLDQAATVSTMSGDVVERYERAMSWVESHHAVRVVAVEQMFGVALTDSVAIAGRVDAILELNGVTTIVDWKRGAVMPSAMLQMAGYRWLAQRSGFEVDDGVVVGLGSSPVHVFRPTAAATLAWMTLVRMREVGGGGGRMSAWAEDVR